ncbi:hypothetical protein AB0N73_04760 [Microbacterium sp. NPDC089189]|uniref:hypothetical protein n=1 Tax=Microbacterium sp. NPDC089189 TaxID=3154972 RepID=UPI00341B5BC8
MTGALVGGRDGGGATVADTAAVLPGRTVVHDRALKAVCEQAAATSFGVQRRQVSVDVGASGALLALRVEAPLAVPPLSDDEAIRRGGDVMARIDAIRNDLHDRVTRLSGRELARIDVVITGAIVHTPRRVR